MSNLSYHGPKPQSKSDFKLAKKHLKDTEDLLEDKIDDHEDAKEDAQDAGNTASAKYNDQHLQAHKKDLSKVNRSINTLKKLKPAVIKQVKNSPGLTNYITKKKVMAKSLAKVSGATS